MSNSLHIWTFKLYVIGKQTLKSTSCECCFKSQPTTNLPPGELTLFFSTFLVDERILSGPQKNKMDKCREFVEVLRRNCLEPHDANLWHLLFEEPDDH